MRFLAPALLCAFSSGLAPAAPHIVIFLTDDLGGDDTSVYGSQHVRTPNIESLASTGMTFENAFIASPACAPSRAALMTGLMPARNGAEANHTYPRPGTAYLTASLNALDYEIAGFGKVVHGNIKPEHDFDYYARPRVGLADNVANFFGERTADGPLCLMVGDRRPHVPWTKDSIYEPEDAGLPPYLIDTPETRAHRAGISRTSRAWTSSSARSWSWRSRTWGTISSRFHQRPWRAMAVRQVEPVRRGHPGAADHRLGGQDQGRHAHRGDGELDRPGADVD